MSTSVSSLSEVVEIVDKRKSGSEESAAQYAQRVLSAKRINDARAQISAEEFQVKSDEIYEQQHIQAVEHKIWMLVKEMRMRERVRT